MEGTYDATITRFQNVLSLAQRNSGKHDLAHNMKIFSCEEAYKKAFGLHEDPPPETLEGWGLNFLRTHQPWLKELADEFVHLHTSDTAFNSEQHERSLIASLREGHMYYTLLNRDNDSAPKQQALELLKFSQRFIQALNESGNAFGQTAYNTLLRARHHAAILGAIDPANNKERSYFAHLYIVDADQQKEVTLWNEIPAQAVLVSRDFTEMVFIRTITGTLSQIEKPDRDLTRPEVLFDRKFPTPEQSVAIVKLNGLLAPLKAADGFSGRFAPQTSHATIFLPDSSHYMMDSLGETAIASSAYRNQIMDALENRIIKYGGRL